MSDYKQVIYETPAEHVARIVLNRPEKRNAQDTNMLYELNDAFDRAAQDDEVRVIILAGAGKDFSSGHDMRETGHLENQAQHRPVTTSTAFHRPGAEGRMAREEEIYVGFCERWRNIPKPTIAEVQGRCIAGGLILIWPCDLIVASEDAQFQDVTLALGIAGAEYFAHPWELGPRKAKDMLFTGAPIGAEEARMLGMVNHVVPRDRLQAATLDLAVTIARQPTFALKAAKMAVNAAQDAQGRQAAMTAAFALHQLGHSHWMEVLGLPANPAGAHQSVARHWEPGKGPTWLPTKQKGA